MMMMTVMMMTMMMTMMILWCLLYGRYIGNAGNFSPHHQVTSYLRLQGHFRGSSLILTVHIIIYSYCYFCNHRVD